MISFVIPCYNTANCLEQLYSQIKFQIEKISVDFEILFVDDCSPQKDYLKIEKLASKDPRVKLVKFVRNFGQQKAISAGIKLSRGDWVIVMDADLEDDPSYIPLLLQKAQDGNDKVLARRMNRTHSYTKKLYSRTFHALFDYLTGIKTDTAIGNYGIYSRKVIDVFNTMDEQFRTFGLLIKWLGFTSAYIDVEHGTRHSGKSSYDFSKGLILALDAMIAFSQKPLKLTVISGFIITLLSLVLGIIFLIRWLFVGIPIIGWTSTVLSIWFLGGFIIMTLGVLGLYIGKIFEETKNRPHYVIDYTLNIEKD
ncbi:MAG: glycosyltransferase family 2 protein [Candidatus Cloacimonetes bacterium]|nr:glycosyltransferase family 2 protein [Candidatus Cloacimonadota bacterium]